MPADRAGLRLAARLGGVLAAAAIMLGGPVVTLAHGMSATYQSPLPLAVYLVGAAATVALSFVFVLARDLRAAPVDPGRRAQVPAVVRYGLRAIGLLAWAWIMAQGVAGGSSDASVAGLFLWVYGWVGVAMLSALVFPVWEWLDPFTTLFDLLAGLLRRLGIAGAPVAILPRRARGWPAVAGLVFVVWLELVAVPGSEGLTVVVLGYTILTLVLMAQFGRDQWRAYGETFTVWFRTLNRLAAVGVAPSADPRAGEAATDGRSVLRRPFASGLLDATWERGRIAVVAVGAGSIIFDGISQTVPFATVFGPPSLLPRTVLLLAWLAVVAGAALLVARTVSPGAIGAGLVPIAVGYLFAHYLTYVLFDGQRLLIAISDPLQQGWDLVGTAFYEVQTGWLPPGLLWTAQLAAVVGGHMLGAWAGHVTAQRDIEAARLGREERDFRHRRIQPAATPGRAIATRNVRLREVPLAIVMVALTTVTLWSLGQAVVVEPDTASVPAIAATR